MYAPNGRLLFVREGKLLAQRFDPDRLEVTGDAVPIAEHMNEDRGVGLGRGTGRLSHALRG